MKLVILIVDTRGIQLNDTSLTFWGIIVGLLSFLAVLSLIFFFLQRYELNRKSTLNIVLLGAIGHFLGGLAYFWFSTHVGSDSNFYFQNAALKFSGFGYYFAFLVLGYLKKFIVGESFLGAFLFFAAVSFLGSIFYLVTFKILLDKIQRQKKDFYITKDVLFYPTVILICWPSYFFWGAGLVKDSFSYFSIGIFLYLLVEGKITLPRIFLFLLAAFLLMGVRPYLLIIFTITAVFYFLIGTKWNIILKITLVTLTLYALYTILPQIGEAGRFQAALNMNTATSYIIRQQTYMSEGTAISMPTHNPHLVFLFLPYLMLCNLFMPLFIGARNVIGLLGSVENVYFVLLVIFFLKNKLIWQQVRAMLPVLKFLMIFFALGMACLSMMNTNLGLAMREKMMYVPCFLIIILLVYTYKKILIMQHHSESLSARV